MKAENNGFFFKNPFIKSAKSCRFPIYPNVTKCNLHGRKSQTIVCDINGGLLRTESFFPYFMLVAFDGGSIFRALLLLISWPFLCVLGNRLKMRLMIFITFCGLKIKDMESVSRAVLPKFYLENLNLYAYEALNSTGCKVIFTSVPRVMVEEFCKEYLSIDRVIGTELHAFGPFFSGLLAQSGLLIKHRALEEFFGDKRPDLGIGTSSFDDHLLISFCKEAYLVSKEDTSSEMPRNKYPKPLVFHDGRLAFLPTPSAALAMFMWLPCGLILSTLRIFLGIVLPYKISIFLGNLSGITMTSKGSPPKKPLDGRGVLYVCTHRTLLDPIFLSISLGKSLTAVTYSISKISEILAPIKTVRLTRNREQDGETMKRLLREGDLVVCPEGTTCREPYLLRFSSLFAELTDEIVPVAIYTNVSMFYGTTARGLKCLDPLFFFMNPRPCYSVHILEKINKDFTGKSSREVANYIQRELANALGFECTNLTRRDKYLLLAGNEGVV